MYYKALAWEKGSMLDFVRYELIRPVWLMSADIRTPYTKARSLWIATA
jgi:hypothetical protein